MRKQYFHPRCYQRILILILLLACVYVRANAQNTEVSTRLDKDSIRIGAQTVLHVSARIPVKSDISFPQLKDSIGKIKIVNGPKTNTTFDKNNGETITHNYTITAFDSGTYVIPELEFHTNAVTFKTGKTTLRVTSVPVDTTKAFYDIKQPFVVHYTFWDWLKEHWLLVTLILGALLILTAMIYYLKKRPQAITIEKAPTALSVDAIALNKLYELRDKKLWQQNEVKLHYSELVDILKEYLEKRYDIHTQEQTTAEILAGLKDKPMPENGRKSLEGILTLADLAKFAKREPSTGENEQCIQDAIDFIRQTKEEFPA
jgi:hypothetical protein